MDIVSRRIVHAAIITVWVVTMALLLFRHYGPHQGTDAEYRSAHLPEELFEEQWMGAYHGKEKIGYSRWQMEKTPEGYLISEMLVMRLGVMGEKKDIDTNITARLNSDLRLHSFELVLRADTITRISGKVEDTNLHVLIESSGSRSEQNFTLRERPLLSLSLPPALLREGLLTGKKLSMMTVDPSTLSQGQMNLEVAGREQLMIMGERRDAFKVTGSIGGSEFTVWLTEKGQILKEDSALGITLIRERKEDAVKITGSPSDLIEKIAVPFNLSLPDSADYLKVRVTGIDTRGLDLGGGRQDLDGDILTVKKEDLSSLKGPYAGIPDAYLAETAFIQAKSRQIVSLSKDIVKDEQDILRKAKLIHEWVYRNIDKIPSVTVPSATEVLRTRRGDCNEHTTLFAALSRAAGVPTRISLGLVYQKGSFYYHAWPEIFAGQWVALDPTLGQFPADATHIRLVTGDFDKQMQLMSVVGRIRLEGLEYR